MFGADVEEEDDKKERRSCNRADLERVVESAESGRAPAPRVQR